MERFSLEDLRALPALESLRSTAGHSANILTIKRALLGHIMYLQPQWKRDSALALFGLSVETLSSPLPDRREAAGETWEPPVAGNTFRVPRHGESRIVSELAAAIHEGESSHILNRSSEKRPSPEQVRSLASIEAEQRTGYRWVSYRRVVSWAQSEQKWRNGVMLTIEALRPGVRIVEYDYAGSRFIIIGKPIVVPEANGKTPTYLSSVDANFYSPGYYRARFDLGREVLPGKQVTLLFSYYMEKLQALLPRPIVGVQPRFDRMELIELTFIPPKPEQSILVARNFVHLGTIIEREWHTFVLEDRLVSGDFTGMFTAQFMNPLVGMSYNLELIEAENVNVRELVDKYELK